jgi:hypothetical protein
MIEAEEERVPIEAVWWIHSLPVGHGVADARLQPDGPGHSAAA